MGGSIPRWIALSLVVATISGCATLERLGERLCGIELIHATFCDPEEPEGDE